MNYFKKNFFNDLVYFLLMLVSSFIGHLLRCFYEDEYNFKKLMRFHPFDLPIEQVIGSLVGLFIAAHIIRRASKKESTSEKIS